MNWSRAMCLIGSHELTKWRKGGKPPSAWIQVGDKAIRPPTQERHCKRAGCKYAEVKVTRVKRPSNFADTVTFVPIMPPKDEK